MRCPHCNAPADVLETRRRADGVTRRRYVCFNAHRFTTLEVAVVNKLENEK